MQILVFFHSDLEKLCFRSLDPYLHHPSLDLVFRLLIAFILYGVLVDMLIPRPLWVVREVRFHVRKYNIVVSVLESDAPRKSVGPTLITMTT